MNFLDVYSIHGPDSIAISKALNIPEHEADHLINTEMDRAYEERRELARAYQRQYNIRRREQLREIRAGRVG